MIEIALGDAAGALLRRTLPAMAVTLAGFIAVRVVVTLWLRSHYMSPVTVIYNVFGWPFTSMVPVIGQDHLQLGPEGIGVLASMDGIGAFVGAVLMAAFCKPAFYRRAYVGGVLLYMVMLTAFALIPLPAIAGSALLFTGLGGAGFSIMQATLVYLSSPPEMRSRMLGVLSVCIGV